jgi:hypothetical protein
MAEELTVLGAQRIQLLPELPPFFPTTLRCMPVLAEVFAQKVARLREAQSARICALRHARIIRSLIERVVVKPMQTDQAPLCGLMATHVWFAVAGLRTRERPPGGTWRAFGDVGCGGRI